MYGMYGMVCMICMVCIMYDMVWSINPGNDNLPDTIARMKEFSVEIENSHDISLIFDIDKEVMKLQLDMEYRYELLSIFKEAVTNAVRHANARHIQISLRFKNWLIKSDDSYQISSKI